MAGGSAGLLLLGVLPAGFLFLLSLEKRKGWLGYLFSYNPLVFLYPLERPG